MRLSASDLKARFELTPIATYLTNTGRGKSNSVSEFAELLRPSKTYKDRYFPRFDDCRVIFATNTRENRDAMNKKNSLFTIVRGVSEILEEYAGKEVSEEYIRLLTQEPSERTRLKRMEQDGFITSTDSEILKALITKEFTKLFREPFITMTYQKLVMFKSFKFLNNCYVFLDEMRQDRIWTGEGVFKVWGSEYKEKINKRINNFTHSIVDKANKGEIKGIALLSAEESLEAALESPTFPPFRKDYKGTDITYKLSNIDPLHDDKLTICIVHGTSDRRMTKRTFAKLARKQGYKVITDGKYETETGDYEAIGDFTIEGVKGSNKLMDVDLCTIISTPHPQEFTPVMASCELSADEAKALVASDKANQAVGRNTGYRNHGNGKHILIVPENIYSSLNLHTTGNIIYAKKRKDVQNLPDNAASNILKAFYKDNVYYCQMAAYEIALSIKLSADQRLAVRQVKKDIKSLLEYYGLSKKHIREDKLVKVVIEMLFTFNIEQKRKTVAGAKTECYCEKEIQHTAAQQALLDDWQALEDLEAIRDLTKDERKQRKALWEAYCEALSD
ncbi:hypothetical protein HGP28_08960 [Vibrio sp. SM6]|uniref:Uncharacterized protein n=1 Tax=Vibrio agarilyticus TaxID=2726741 RepID=A0A7X8YH27_9VIBR|nr:hypothetical protein [Vibrio agarilyticus]NLS13016.1 hypothetical protein [Vibrio agarilyticus]